MLRFKQYLLEATIWDDANHQSGETFEVKSNATAAVKKAFSIVKGNSFVKIAANEYSSSTDKQEIRIPANHEPELNSIVFYFRDSTKRAYKVSAVPTLSNGNFKWTTAGKSTNRGELTELKELASLEMMLNAINGTTLPKDSDELASMVKTRWGFEKANEVWRDIYYTSALAHSKLTKKMPFKGIYLGERQQAGFTAPIYKLATKLTKKSADNWNPSDVWFVRTDQKSMINTMIMNLETSLKNKIPVDKVAYQLKDMMDVMLKEGILIGVSLKQINKGSGSSSLVTFDDVKQKLADMDFSIIKNYIRISKKGLPAYGELSTRSGFNIKWGGRANAQKANINIEGQMAKSTHQLGALDANKIKQLAKEKRITILGDSDFGRPNSNNLIKIAPNYLNYLKVTDINTHNMFVGKLDINGLIDKYGWVECKRFIANISVFQFMNSLTEKDILNLFLLAKKVDKVNPNYYLFE